MALDDSRTAYTLYDLRNGIASCINPSKLPIWCVRLGKLQRLCTENGVFGNCDYLCLTIAGISRNTVRLSASHSLL
jgi:hypothetical protein